MIFENKIKAVWKFSNFITMNMFQEHLHKEPIHHKQYLSSRVETMKDWKMSRPNPIHSIQLLPRPTLLDSSVLRSPFLSLYSNGLQINASSFRNSWNALSTNCTLVKVRTASFRIVEPIESQIGTASLWLNAPTSFPFIPVSQSPRRIIHFIFLRCIKVIVCK